MLVAVSLGLSNFAAAVGIGVSGIDARTRLHVGVIFGLFETGMPILGLATTEMATVVENGVSGYVDTNLQPLIARMRELLRAPAEARRLGEGARRLARERFNIQRFARDWEETFALVTGRPRPGRTAVSARLALATGGTR